MYEEVDNTFKTFVRQQMETHSIPSIIEYGISDNRMIVDLTDPDQIHKQSFCITGLLVSIPTRQLQRIAVKILQHIDERETVVELIKQDCCLTPVPVKGMFIVGYAVTICVSTSFSYRTSFANPCRTGYICDIHSPENISIFFFQNGLSRPINMRDITQILWMLTKDLSIVFPGGNQFV